jgi:DNA polymerase elongation subunit (family B)
LNQILFFDIETSMNEEAVEFMPEINAPSNYKDPEKIASYIAEKKTEQLATAALDSDLGKIISISIQSGLEGNLITHLVGDSETPTETDLINWFWYNFAESSGFSCGYNILGFDFPYLLRRSFALGIKIPVRPQMIKYRIEPTTDLMAILYNWGPARGLKWVCKRYGINNPLPDLDGSQVKDMDKETLRKYSGNDVYLVVELYKKMLGVYL